MQIVPAVIVMTLNSKETVAREIARGHERVVCAARRVLDESEDGTALVREEAVADRRAELQEPRAAGFHRHPFRGIASAERPRVDHLRAVSGDDRDALAR